MDNAQKAIMIGVGLFITIIIIAAVMLITGMGQDLMNSGTQQLSQMSAQLEKQLTQDYDGTTLTGGQVLAAVKKYHGDSSMIVEVNNGSGEHEAGGLVPTEAVTGDKDDGAGFVATGTEENTSIVPLANFSDRTKTSQYIVTTAKYKANLIRINGGVFGIRFDKKS